MSEYNADVSCCKDSGFPPTTADPPVYRQADTILVFARNEKVDPVVADLLLECIVKQFIACTFQHLGDDILVNISQVSGEFVGKWKMFGFSRYAGRG